jgi:glycosyl transferase family 2
MRDACRPELSVVLVTPDRYETIRETVRHLQAQTVREQLELVIVGPSRAAVAPPNEELTCFGGWQVVEVGEIRASPAARVAGIHAASAPLVVFAEDHAFPEPGWAEALLRAHKGPWAAVGPVFRIAGCKNAVGQASLLIGYLPWTEPVEAGEVEDLPGRNTCYRRSLLLEYGAGLEEMLVLESRLHADLRRKGHRLYLEPGAGIRHVMFSRLGELAREQFLVGRMFGAGRAACWSPLRRLFYAAAAPAVPLLRTWRISRRLPPSSPLRAQLPALLPVLLAGLCVSALGEATGYLAGARDASEKMTRMEFHR